MAKPFRPQIVSGNLLRSGEVVYRLGDGGWGRDFREAAVAHDAETAQNWLNIAETQSDLLIGVYLITVELKNNRPEPTHYRDRIRVLGPTFAHQANLVEQWQEARERDFA